MYTLKYSGSHTEKNCQIFILSSSGEEIYISYNANHTHSAGMCIVKYIVKFILLLQNISEANIALFTPRHLFDEFSYNLLCSDDEQSNINQLMSYDVMIYTAGELASSI